MKRVAIATLVLLVGACIGYWFALPRERFTEAGSMSPHAHRDTDIQWLDTGLTADQRTIWHRTPEGSEVLPLSLLESLEDFRTGRPFIEVLTRFGFLDDPTNPHDLPVGWSTAELEVFGTFFVGVGINCSACHTGELHYQGKSLRFDGGPNLVDVELMVRDLEQSLSLTLDHPTKAFLLLRNLIRKHHDPHKPGELLEVPADTLKALDEIQPDGNDPAHTAAIEFLGRSLRSVVSAEESFLHDDFKGRFGTNGTHEGALGKLQDHVFVTMESMVTFKRLLKRKADYLKRLSWAFANQTPAGPGRADSFDVIRDLIFPEQYRVPMNAPVSIPDLFGLEHYQWIHWDGNTSSVMQRNVAQAIALGADFDTVTFDSSVLPRNIHRLESMARDLQPPAWPEAVLGTLDRDLVGKGERLFAEHCARCHHEETLVSPEEVGTDPDRVNFFKLPIGNSTFAQALQTVSQQAMAATFKKHNITPDEAAHMVSTNAAWRTTGKYQTRELRGVWVSAPYLHNGSVPSLYDLLRPAKQRPQVFALGQRDFDPKKVGYVTHVTDPVWVYDTRNKGNSNQGHEFGTSLPEEDRWALIEYLKTR